MSQLHKRFSTEQIKLVLGWYEQKQLSKAEVLARLEVKESQFYELLWTFMAESFVEPAH